MKKNNYFLREWEILGLQKLLRIMKLTAFLLLISVISVFASKTYSQTKVLNIKMKSSTVKEVLQNIEGQSEFYFMYSEKLVDVNRKVSVNVRSKKIDEVLDLLFAGTNVEHTVKDRFILLTTPEVYYDTSIENIQKNKTITGNVTDSDGQPLPGVTVLIKGTTKGTVTNTDGNYSLSNVPSDATLVFSFIGMVTQEIVVGDKTNISITMQFDAIALEEVVSIGYGTVKKRDLTGAVSSIKAEKLVEVAAPSVGKMISGKIAGLTVVNTSAQPGGGVKWQIRGAATGRSPLIIIDGFPITGKSEPGSGNRYRSGSKATTLNMINPNDIASIEVLKDASATAIYGARAAGGVIIITTKRGSEGKVNVDYRGSYSWQNYYRLTEVLGPKDFMTQRNEVHKEKFMRDQQVYPYGEKSWEEVAPQYPGPIYSEEDIKKFTGGTDWVREVLRQGFIMQHDITMTGGSNTTKYLLSFSSFNQDGIVKNNGFDRYSGRLNLDQKLGKWINAGVTSTYSITKEANIPLGSGTNENSGIFNAALQMDPTLPVKDSLGNYTLNPEVTFMPNPVSLLEIDDITSNEDFLVNSYIEAKPVQGLRLKLVAGMDRYGTKRNTYLPTTTLYGAQVGGQASISSYEKTDMLFNFIAHYSKVFAGKHNIDILGGYEFQKSKWEGYNAGNTKFPYDAVKWYNLSLGENEKPDVGSFGGSSEIASFFSRLNYSYNNKYLLTVNLRYDGSSNFATNHQWGFFPGIAFAWRISEENFLSNSSWLSNLKLRVGFGQTGNDRLTGVRTYYSPGFDFPFGGISRTGIGLRALGNPNLKWETQTDLNLGLDFGFLNNRISGNIELYDRVISDVLGKKPLMSYNVVTSISYNLDAEKQTRGIDFQLSTINISQSDFQWVTDFNVTYYRDRWRKRDPSWKPDINDEEQAVWGTHWSYLSDGLIKVGEDVPWMPGYLPGQVKIKDVNGYLVDENGDRIFDENGKPQYLGEPDGEIDKADLVKINVNVPVQIGFINTFSYKNFDVSFNLYGFFNNKNTSPDNTYYANAETLDIGKNVSVNAKERWTYKNMDATRPTIFTSIYGFGDYFYEKSWFIRLNNLSLGYSFHLKNVEIFKLFVNARNLFIITPYSGMDPETGSGLSYPPQRTIGGGIEVKF